MNTKNIDTSTIGGRIKQLRENNGITQAQLVNMMGFEGDGSRISKVESGNAEPNCGELVEMSRIFNTTTDYILQGAIGEAPLPVLTPEEQGFILDWAKKIHTFQNGKATC